MLRHPLSAHSALSARIFRTTESPIAGPAPFPDLVRLVRTFYAQGPTRGEDSRCRLAPPEPAAVSYRAYSSSSALFFRFFPGPKPRKPSMRPLRRLWRIRRTLSPAAHGAVEPNAAGTPDGRTGRSLKRSW
jgi:hypothetical protein